MKKVALIGCILFLAACSRNNRNSDKDEALQEKSLPSFQLTLMDSVTTLNTDNIPDGKPIIIIFLSPNCPYCKAETEYITNNYESIGKLQIILISSHPYDQLKKYYDQFNLKNYPKIIVAQDRSGYFINYYRPSSVPYAVLYDKEKQFKKVLLGRIKLQQIKDALE